MIRQQGLLPTCCSRTGTLLLNYEAACCVYSWSSGLLNTSNRKTRSWSCLSLDFIAAEVFLVFTKPEQIASVHGEWRGAGVSHEHRHAASVKGAACSFTPLHSQCRRCRSLIQLERELFGWLYINAEGRVQALNLQFCFSKLHSKQKTRQPQSTKMRCWLSAVQLSTSPPPSLFSLTAPPSPRHSPDLPSPQSAAVSVGECRSAVDKAETERATHSNLKRSRALCMCAFVMGKIRKIMQLCDGWGGGVLESLVSY